MSVEAISTGGRRGYSRRSRLLAWVWPDPLEDDTRDRDAWIAGLLGWLWPSALHDERFGRRHGLMATLFGWAWPSELDNSMKRFWRKSWLWSWMWPGRVSGPDGEICALAPWHPAVRPEICEGEPWSRKIGRHGGVVFMMFAAGAIAAPTFMPGNNGALDGGRINLFRSDPAGGDSSSTGGGEAGGGAGGDADAGGGSGGTGGGDGAGGDGPPGGDPSNNSNPDFPNNPTGDGFGGGLGGDPPGDPGPGDSDPGDPNDPGPTFIDPGPDGVNELAPEPGLTPGGGGGSGGGGGGGGSGGGGGGGGDPEGGDPFTPPNPLDPPTDKPVFPELPGSNGPSGGGGGGGGCVGACLLLPPTSGDPKTDTPRDPAGAVPEPGAWAMMILGFGLAGYAIRRRRVAYRLG